MRERPIFCILAALVVGGLGASKTATTPRYLIQQPGCRISNFQLAIENSSTNGSEYYESRCNTSPELLIKSHTNNLQLAAGAQDKNCCASPFRPLPSPCFPLRFGEQNNLSSLDLREFLVNCSNQVEFHYRFTAHHLNFNITKKIELWKDKQSRPFNVMLVIVMHLSRFEALHSLPRTVKYLKEDLEFIDYKGIHSHDSFWDTTLRVIRMGEVPFFWERTFKRQSDVWKSFGDNGYLTMLADNVNEGKFFYFEEEVLPTDFNIQTLLHAVHRLNTDEAIKFAKKNDTHPFIFPDCINNKKSLEFLLDYTADFAESYPRAPKYSNTMVSPSRSLPQEKTDDIFLKYYTRLKKNSNFIENSVIIFASEHGIDESLERNKHVSRKSNTSQPMFMMRLPRRFKDMYPIHAKNAEINSERLTSNSDVFETIAHLFELMTNRSEFNHVYPYPDGKTFFEEIPNNRSCSDISIVLEQQCSCESAETSGAHFLINQPGCKIPILPAAKMHQMPGVTCARQVLATISNGSILRLTEEAKEYDRCYIREILSAPNYAYSLGESIPVEVDMDFRLNSTLRFLVNCTSYGPPKSTNNSRNTMGINKPGKRQDVQIYYNFPTDYPEKKFSAKIKDAKVRKASPHQLDVMLLIVDSLSRVSAKETLPETLKYLTKDLNFIDYKGYHGWGDPSHLNYFAITLGLLLDESRPDAGWGGAAPHIWKNFSDANYLTMHAENINVEINNKLHYIYDYTIRRATHQQPIDFSIRPFVMKENRYRWFGELKTKPSSPCIQDKSASKFLLDNTLDFINAYPFASKFITAFIHRDERIQSLVDAEFLNFYSSLNSTFYDNTIIFFVSDHAPKPALESKNIHSLPLLMIHLPKKFIDSYPKLAENVKMNSDKLTSHLDLFKTLRHLHQLVTNKKYGSHMKYGRSLFGEIFSNRTCKDIPISGRFCSCIV